MIVAIAEANVEDTRGHDLVAAWSNLVVGDKPSGLVECLLLEGEDRWQVISLWADEAALAEAEREERLHPAFVVFDAASHDVNHRSLKLVGRITVGR